MLGDDDELRELSRDRALSVDRVWLVAVLLNALWLSREKVDQCTDEVGQQMKLRQTLRSLRSSSDALRLLAWSDKDEECDEGRDRDYDQPIDENDVSCVDDFCESTGDRLRDEDDDSGGAKTQRYAAFSP